MELKLLNGLSMNKEGILVNTNGDSIHLRQGDMDGACGPYCVAMSLLAMGKMLRDDISPGESIDYRCRYGKMLKTIKNLEPMVLGGTTSEFLCEMIKAHNTTDCNVRTGSSGVIIPIISQELEENNPVIFDVHSRKENGLHHWTVAIGKSDQFIFLLDPGYELIRSNFWNATLDTKASSNRFGYRYANPWYCEDVELSTAIVLKPH